MAITCTPSSLISTNPCLNCLSNKELIAVIMYVFAHTNGHTVTEALTNSACFNCLSEKQKLVALVTILADTYLSGVSVPAIINEMKCLECAADSQITAAALSEICTYYTSNQ